jgi:hypothetical protein
MDRLYKRPMFRRGGSANSNGTGITSGLAPRQGYDNGGSSRQRIMNAMGANPPKRNFNDFLINFGLDIASRPPEGNIFQTAAASAKDPYDKFSKARNAESNLMRQVGMESEMMDIKNEQSIAAAEALEGGATKRLQMKIKSDAETYDKQLLIQEALDKKKWVAEYAATNRTNSQEGENMYEWTFEIFNKPENVGKINGGSISQDVLLNARKRSNDAKSKLKGKNKAKAEKSLYYDKVQGTVLKIGVNANGDITYIPVESFTEKSVVAEVPKKYTGETFYEKMTGKEAKPYTYKDYIKSTDETTKKVIDTVTTPVDLQTIDTSNIRKYR